MTDKASRLLDAHPWDAYFVGWTSEGANAGGRHYGHACYMAAKSRDRIELAEVDPLPETYWSIWPYQLQMPRAILRHHLGTDAVDEDLVERMARAMDSGELNKHRIPVLDLAQWLEDGEQQTMALEVPDA